MKISLVTPAGKQSRSGNRTTAVRWARILRSLGHGVEIEGPDADADGDILVAIHAFRSHAAIRSFSDRHPDRPLVVLLAGTDIYRFQKSDPEETLDSMARADALVCLHDLVHRAIPRRFTAKLRVIRQSATPLPRPRTPSRQWFEVCVAGHLREEKDPLRAAFAARLVPAESQLRIVHLGGAVGEGWAKRAREEARTNPRYVWRGEVPGWQVRRGFARAHAMVISSVMEGGANIVSEAVVAGVPVIASRIDGNVGLLGEDYGGYFPAGDERSLAALLWRAETDPALLAGLDAQCRRLRPSFHPKRERTAWRTLLREVSG
jgi:putative glycosyltransferase (TIGR04348 family)